MIRAVLFDLDGTLINTNELIIKSFKHTYKSELNLEVEELEIYSHFGEPLFKTLSYYGEENVDRLLNTYREYNSKMHDGLVSGFPMAREAVAGLKEMGLIVGVVTSKRKEMTGRSLKAGNLENTMDIIVTPEDTTAHKPDPEPILFACKALNINPDEVLYVGDTSFDLNCSRRAGAKNCLVTYTVLPIEELMKLKPDFTIDNLMELIELVKDENSRST